MNDSGLGITKENLLLILPPALTQDPAMMARAAADAEALAARLGEIDRVRVISNIDGLDEAVLDILARDFKVDWWDPEYSIEEKRRTLKGSWRVHKILGTKAAVETALNAIYPNTYVEEWFQYGGRPYHFRVILNMTGTHWSAERPKDVLERVKYYKSLRSHLDGLITVTELDSEPIHVLAGLGPCISKTELPVRDPPYQDIPTQVVSGIMGCISIVQPPGKAPPYRETLVQMDSTIQGCISTIHAPDKMPVFHRKAVAARGELKSSLTITELPEIRREDT